MLPNETLQDETRPGSVRGEANGEGQPVARMPAVDHKQCSSPQAAPIGDDDALHTMVQYHIAGEEEPWSRCQEATWESHKTCAGAEPKDHGQPQYGSVSKFAVSTCMS